MLLLPGAVEVLEAHVRRLVVDRELRHAGHSLALAGRVRTGLHRRLGDEVAPQVGVAVGRAQRLLDRPAVVEAGQPALEDGGDALEGALDAPRGALEDLVAQVRDQQRELRGADAACRGHRRLGKPRPALRERRAATLEDVDQLLHRAPLAWGKDTRGRSRAIMRSAGAGSPSRIHRS